MEYLAYLATNDSGGTNAAKWLGMIWYPQKPPSLGILIPVSYLLVFALSANHFSANCDCPK